MIFDSTKPRTFKVLSSNPKYPKLGDTVIYTLLDEETNTIFDTPPEILVAIIDKEPEWGPIKY